MADFDSSYTKYQAHRSSLRKLARRAYLQSARSLLHGATLDFGCGVGDLLVKLPAGSMGLEYNRTTVDHCRHKGLDVCWYDGLADNWQLSPVPHGRRFESMVVSHVLEHLDEPIAILRRLLLASCRLGIARVLVIVPGRAGYRIDATHRTFIDRAMLEAAGLAGSDGFVLDRARYFPGNVRSIGDWFPHHELQVLFLRSQDSPSGCAQRSKTGLSPVA